MSSTVNARYFGMNKHQLRDLVTTGEPDEVNGAQAELDRRAANKATKRANRNGAHEAQTAVQETVQEVTGASAN